MPGFPQPGFIPDQFFQCRAVRKPYRETGSQVPELLRNLQCVTDKHQVFFYLVEIKCDFLDQPDMCRIIQKRVKIEQYVVTGTTPGFYVFQHLGWRSGVFLVAVIHIQPG